MRTDVKIGFVFAFVVLVGLVAYFALQQKKLDTVAPVAAKTSADLTTGTEPPAGAGVSLDTGLHIPPPGAATTGPSGGVLAAAPTGTLSGTQATTAPGAGYPSGFATTLPTLAATRPGGDLAETRSTWDTTPTTRAGGESAGGGFSWDTPTTRTAGGGDSQGGLTPGGDGTRGGMDSMGGTGGAATTYAIAKGDTFGKLAAKFHVTVKAIETANPGVSSSKLKINQKINIPAASGGTGAGAGLGMGTDTALSLGGATTTPAHGHASTRPSRRGHGSGAGHTATTSHAAATSPAGGESGTPGGTYTVQKGDTLRAIAKRVYGDEKYWERIARVNRSKLSDPDALKVNMVLQLPPK